MRAEVTELARYLAGRQAVSDQTAAWQAADGCGKIGGHKKIMFLI